MLAPTKRSLTCRSMRLASHRQLSLRLEPVQRRPHRMK
jgi:hypothetical protein